VLADLVDADVPYVKDADERATDGLHCGAISDQ
jgi:hypothetical protein